MLNLQIHYTRLSPSPQPSMRPMKSCLNQLKNSSTTYRRLKKFLIADTNLTYIHKFKNPQKKLAEKKSSTPTLPILIESNTVAFLPPINSEEFTHKLNPSSILQVRPSPIPEKSELPSLPNTQRPVFKPKIYETQKIRSKFFPRFKERTQNSVLKKRIIKMSSSKKQEFLTENEKICGWEA